MDLFSFVVELLVSEKTGIDAAFNGATEAFVSGLLLSFFGNAYFDQSADPFVGLFWLHIDKEKPLAALKLIDCLLRYSEYIPSHPLMLLC